MIKHSMKSDSSAQVLQAPYADKFAVRLDELETDLLSFLHNHFRGAYRLSSSLNTAKKAYISLHGCALILKTALMDVFGKYVVEISLGNTREHFKITIFAKGHSFRSEHFNALGNTVERFGIEISDTGSALELKADLLKMPIFNVRTTKKRTFYDALLYHFGITEIY